MLAASTTESFSRAHLRPGRAQGLGLGPGAFGDLLRSVCLHQQGQSGGGVAAGRPAGGVYQGGGVPQRSYAVAPGFRHFRKSRVLRHVADQAHGGDPQPARRVRQRPGAPVGEQAAGRDRVDAVAGDDGGARGWGAGNVVVDNDRGHAGQGQVGLHAQVGDDHAAGRGARQLGPHLVGPGAFAPTHDAHADLPARGAERPREQRPGGKPIGVVVAQHKDGDVPAERGDGGAEGVGDVASLGGGSGCVHPPLMRGPAPGLPRNGAA